MSTAEASCVCGGLRLRCTGDPIRVAMCHCDACQRRTGSAFNLGAWFSADSVEIVGDPRAYHRTGDTGSPLTFYFCPTCGSNLYWESARRPGVFGVAVGGFADPDFPEPTVSVYGSRRHRWVEVPDGIPQLSAGPGSERDGAGAEDP